MSHYSAISWRKQAIFNEMTIHCLLCTRSTHCWIFLVLVHWNTSLWVDLSLHPETLTWIWANQSLLMFLNTASGAIHTNLIVFGLIRPTIYYTWGKPLHQRCVSMLARGKPLHQRCVSMLAHWNNRLRIDILSRFKDNQSLLFLLNAACLAEK